MKPLKTGDSDDDNLETPFLARRQPPTGSPFDTDRALLTFGAFLICLCRGYYDADIEEEIRSPLPPSNPCRTCLFSTSMITFDTVSQAEMEAMCTPMHRILSPTPAISNTSKPTGTLYLGSMAAMHDGDLLREHRITHLVQVLEVPWLPQEDSDAATVFTYHRIDLEDRTSAALRPHLAAACDFIHAALGRGENVLVHCQQGVSRSASIVIAYLVREHAMSYDSAFALVKARRACIRPNSGFVVALRDWETACTLRNKRPILVSTPKTSFDSNTANRYMRDRFAQEPIVHLNGDSKSGSALDVHYPAS